MINQIFTIILALTLSTQSLSAQEIFYPANYEFECDGKVVMPDVYQDLYVYNGDDPNIETREKKVSISTGKTVWEKKKADRNCLSPNPDDCLVWCQVEETEEKTYRLVSDTASTTEWYIEKHKIKKGGKKVEMSVLCKDNLSQNLLNALRDQLFKLGYDVSPDKTYKNLKGKFNKEFKQFQKDYDLPVGKWTEETMTVLYNLGGS